MSGAPFQELQQGDLSALLDYLQNSDERGMIFAAELTEMLSPDGNTDWKMQLVRRTKNRRTIDREHRDSYKRLEVGAWAHVWIGGHPRSTAQIVRHEIAEHFGVGETYVRESLAYFRQFKALWEGETDRVPKGAPRDYLDFAYAKTAMCRAEEALAASRNDLSED